MPNALLSVHDKTGLVDLARGLHALGWTLIASGGTARQLRAAGLPVTEVSDYTGSPEILGGRVKTLHPAIHGGLLARPLPEDQADLARLNFQLIDLVIVNLYPFEATIAQPGVSLAEAIEQIDIGGVALIRAAAKNHARVTLVCDPADYGRVLGELQAEGVSAATRRRLAVKGFAQTAHYDALITDYLARLDQPADAPAPLRLTAYPVQALRYGENPHQAAALYGFAPDAGPLGGTVLQGKELSYNNLLDLDAAWRCAVSYGAPAVCIVKHLSPCGVAVADTLAAAYQAAFASDRRSAFGGVIAANRPFDGETAAALGDLFVECLAAPAFTDEARALLAKKKSCRLVQIPALAIQPRFELRSLTGGLLKQDADFGDPAGTNWQVASRRPPTEAEWAALRFAWVACQHVKSNAIVLARAIPGGVATVGIGGGQPNRVDCVRIAAERAGDQARGAVMASDAFFPFPDSVEAAARAGVTAIVHPGGSVRDAESLAAADAAGMALVVTGVRHFRH
ncbi:MAG: bifunctional phosphoribosylaminoimidazolecarboxamide formyltransferase/IMP cyclohydrolase [Anaerolineales bacterium]|nr:bifunctional phosphoribosylaminoimidazolecarboxamide formyltransferase/IMP cyclohydrolase [Anaerolineales bacterium]